MRKLATAPALLGAMALVAMLAPGTSYALGGDPNLLVKTNPAPKGQGYVLFSMIYLKSNFMKNERPCLRVEMTPVATADPGRKNRKPKSQYLTTTTGLHCNTAWSNEQSIREDEVLARVVILTAVPAGEYEIGKGSIQYNIAMTTYKSDPGVVGLRSIKVEEGKVAYAGAFRLLTSAGRSLFAVGDYWAEDEPVLRQLRPDLASVEIVKAAWVEPPGNQDLPGRAALRQRQAPAAPVA